MSEFKSRTSKVDIYRELKSLITTRQFFPFEHLNVISLSERFKVSVTPVREALQRLYAEKLVVADPQRGFCIKPLDELELRGVYTLTFVVLRHAIETNLEAFSFGDISIPQSVGHGRRAFSPEGDRLTPSDLTWLESLAERIAGLGSYSAAVEAVRNTNDRTRAVRLLELENVKFAGVITCDMAGFVEALETRSAQAAIASLEEQLDHQLDRLPEIIKEALLRAHAERIPSNKTKMPTISL